MVKEGESLPRKGSKQFKAAESLRAGGSGALRFKIWEGDITDHINDNRFIGELTITGTDFDDGIISQGAELNCDYEVLDSGNIIIQVSVPSIGGTFHSGRNFYSRQEAQIDYSNASKRVQDDAEKVRSRIDHINSKVDDEKLDNAMSKLDEANRVIEDESDPEVTKKAMDDVLEAKKILAKVRTEHQKEIRQLDLDNTVEFFNEHIRELARTTEASAFDNLARTAQRSIDNNSNDFINHLDELKMKNFQILWRQDWFVVDRYKRHASTPYLFPNTNQYEELMSKGAAAIQSDDIEALREIVIQLNMSCIGSSDDDAMMVSANILRM